jgi:hypothetical protein
MSAMSPGAAADAEAQPTAETILTMVGGRIVHPAGAFKDLDPTASPALTASPAPESTSR